MLLMKLSRSRLGGRLLANSAAALGSFSASCFRLRLDIAKTCELNPSSNGFNLFRRRGRFFPCHQAQVVQLTSPNHAAEGFRGLDAFLAAIRFHMHQDEAAAARPAGLASADIGR